MDAPVTLELTPDQPPAVAAAVAELVAEEAPAPDPWWQAGLEQALAT
jgi:hypothetical protein